MMKINFLLLALFLQSLVMAMDMPNREGERESQILQEHDNLSQKDKEMLADSFLKEAQNLGVMELNRDSLINNGELNLSAKINQQQLDQLAPELAKLTWLNNLYLEENTLTNLPERIGNLKNLKIFNVSKNKLTSLPEEIGKLKNLMFLEISENKLTSLPKSIGELEQLEHLYVYDNQLKSLPEWIGNLKNLRKLNISNNKLTSLPESIGKLQKSTLLIAFGNRISNLDAVKEKLKNINIVADLQSYDFNSYKKKGFIQGRLKGLGDTFMFVGDEVDTKGVDKDSTKLRKFSAHLTQSISEYRDHLQSIKMKLSIAQKNNPTAYQQYISEVFKISIEDEYDPNENALTEKELCDLIDAAPRVLLFIKKIGSQSYNEFIDNVIKVNYRFMLQKVTNKYRVKDISSGNAERYGKLRAWLSSIDKGSFLNRNLRKNSLRLLNKLSRLKDHRDNDDLFSLSYQAGWSLIQDYNHTLASLKVVGTIFKNNEKYEWINERENELKAKWTDVVKNLLHDN